METPPLPPNNQGRFDVTLPDPPRGMYPIHVEQKNMNKKGKYYGEPFTVDLIMMPMESVRQTFPVKCRETPQARKNLQIWVDNMGPALFNPVWWRVAHEPIKKPGKRLNQWLRIVQGNHRLRALEALDFDFIYVYFQIGAAFKTSKKKLELMKRNHRVPTHAIGNKCPQCEKPIKCSLYGIKKPDGSTGRRMKCRHCGYVGYMPIIYPEPM